MQTRAERLKIVQDKIESVKALVKAKYSQDLSDLVVRYDLKGRTAGWAIGHRTIRLNTTAIYGDEAHFKDMVNDTIPHEIAHIVCHRNPSLGRKHDYGWSAVCRALGGTGKSTHDMTTIEFARGRTYIYTSTTGKEYGVSERRHRSIQMGMSCRFRKASYGMLTKDCAYVVKMNGRVISTHAAKTTPGVVDTVKSWFTKPVAPVAVSSFAEAPAEPAVAKPAVAKPAVAKSMPTGTGSFADQVRALIRAAKAAGNGPDYVFRQAVNTLGMKATSARNCVKANWDRA
jgi:predicted SprT family Zn-dependent metalloprotease